MTADVTIETSTPVTDGIVLSDAAVDEGRGPARAGGSRRPRAARRRPAGWLLRPALPALLRRPRPRRRRRQGLRRRQGRHRPDERPLPRRRHDRLRRHDREAGLHDRQPQRHGLLRLRRLVPATDRTAPSKGRTGHGAALRASRPGRRQPDAAEAAGRGTLCAEGDPGTGAGAITGVVGGSDDPVAGTELPPDDPADGSESVGGRAVGPRAGRAVRSRAAGRAATGRVNAGRAGHESRAAGRAAGRATPGQPGTDPGSPVVPPPERAGPGTVDAADAVAPPSGVGVGSAR